MSQEGDIAWVKKVERKDGNNNQEEDNPYNPPPPPGNSKGDLDHLNVLVFGNHLILDKILEHVVFPNNSKELLLKDAIACRHVSHFWLREISFILRTTPEPLFKLVLTVENSVIAVQPEGGKDLHNFVKSKRKQAQLGSLIEPYSITTEEDFFRAENRRDLTKCLYDFGYSLLQLSFKFPRDGGTLVFFEDKNKQMFLPRLTKFKVEFSPDKLKVLSKKQRRKNPSRTQNSTDHCVNLVKIILNSAPNLSYFTLNHDNQMNQIPASVKELVLPEKITQLTFPSELTADQLDNILVKNPLPMLKDLTFALPRVDSADNFLFRILDNCKSTLENFHIYAYHDAPGNDSPRHTFFFRMPVMKKLSNLNISTTLLELEDNIVGDRCLPSLKSLTLLEQGVAQLKKWIHNCTFFPNVTSLLVSVVERQQFSLNVFHCVLRHPWKDFDEELFENLCTVFPNLTHFEFTMAGEYIFGIWVAFEKLTKLKHLIIRVNNRGIAPPVDLWDGLLLGFTRERMASIRENYADNLHQQILNSEFVPIRNLKDLTTITLTDLGFSSRRMYQPDLISDLVFRYAFMKMENLRELHMCGRFKATEEMKEMWENECNGTYTHKQFWWVDKSYY